MYSTRDLKHSQNFIRRPGLAKELVGSSNVGPGDLVVEIGPGKGIITQELLKRAGHVIAIERDPKFAERLSSLDMRGNLQVVICDFLEWCLPHKQYKVFSNIPFNFTADIVTKLTSSKRSPTDIYLIMQESAAHRFAGMPYHKNSQTSILLAVDFAAQILRPISRDCFDPKPSVDIVFVHFTKRTKPPIPLSERQIFRDFVIYGYNQWASTVLEAFSKVFSKKQRTIITESQGLGELKPTDLSLEQWLELFDTFRKYVDTEKQHSVLGCEENLKRMQNRLEKRYRTHV